MVVYNRLTFPGTVTPTVQFNVYVSAGEDFEFHGLRDPRANIFPMSYIQIQSGDDVVYEASLEGMKRENANVVGISKQLISNSTFQSSPEEMKLNKLLTKYQPQFAVNFTITASNSRNLIVQCTPGLIERDTTSDTLPDPIFRNLISHYKQFYAFWCGSLNYFFLHNSTVNNPVILSLTHIPNVELGVPTDYPNLVGNTNDAIAGFSASTTQTPNTNIDLSFTAMYSHLSNIRVNPSVEVTVPHRSKFRRLYPKILGSAADTQATGTLYLRYSNPTTTDQVVALTAFQSIGDDFRFKYLIPALSVQITTNP